METEKKLEVNNKNLPALTVLVLLISLIGGVFGSLIYKDYLSQMIGGNFSIQNTNVRVEESSAVIDAAKKVSPAVVSITGITQQLTFFGGTREAESSGTGFIVRSDGLIVTNKHVVSNSSTKYTVYTNDGKYFDAVVKSIDPVFDIAILKIEASNLPTVELGLADNLLPGQTVIAIGNALGQYQNSVTTGVVSAIGRVIQASDSTGASTESLDNVIQTDAAINPGNSGGPLLNIAGQVIGVNTAVDQSGQAIGFAIPVNLVKSALDSYLTKGKIVRPMLGVRYISLNKDIATTNDLPVSDGALLYSSDNLSVVSGGPADKAGLKNLDIITKIGDDRITQNTTLVSLINKHNVGDQVKLTFLRDSKENTTTVTLVETR